MRVGFAVACLAVLVAAVLGFAGGEWWSGQQENRICEVALSNESARLHAEALLVIQSALDAARQGKNAQSQSVLVRYAKLQGTLLAECSSSPECSSWVGNLMPTKAQLVELRQVKDPQ